MVHFISHVAQFSTIEWILYGSLLFFFLIQLFFYLSVYKKPYTYEKKRKEASSSETLSPGISVIITSKNDAEELKENLPYILEQDYPNFEVIVVNSGSTDETDMVLKAAEQKYPGLYHTYVPAGADGVNEKKLAPTLGIKAAKHEVLLFTEAYCKPCSSQWIQEFGKEFSKGKEVVLGYSRIRFDRKTAMWRFIRYDNLVHHLKFLSMAIAGKPFMGIGRNMAYKKNLFFEQKGFSPILNIDGGEDDLFINRVARKKNTGVVLSVTGMTETGSVDSFSTWRALKSKYVYTKQFYKGVSAHLFAWETLSRYAFYIAFLTILLSGAYRGDLLMRGVALFFFFCRYFVQLIVINKNSDLLDERRYHLNLLLFDLFQPINNQRFRRYANQRNRHNF